MVEDARFEDGDETPLRLMAQEASDLPVMSTLLQDAIAQTSEVVFERKKRRFSLLLNRFRWEDADAAHSSERPFERVQTVLVFESVQKVSTQSIDLGDKDLIMPLIAIEFEERDTPGGLIKLVFSGDGMIGLTVECVDARLKDVSRPYQARASRAPFHPVD